MITDVHHLEHQRDAVLNFTQRILDLCEGNQAGFVKTSLTLALASCINKNDDDSDKIIDLNLIKECLVNICKIPTLH